MLSSILTNFGAKRYWHRLLSNWLPVLGWAGLIFYLSQQPQPLAGLEKTLQSLISLVSHLLEYLVLAVLLGRALQGENLPTKKALSWALGLAIAYGALDEFHQLFVIGRDSNLIDLGVDALGAFIGVSWLSPLILKKPLPRAQPTQPKISGLNRLWLF